jgi:hypothetical protein
LLSHGCGEKTSFSQCEIPRYLTRDQSTTSFGWVSTILGVMLSCMFMGLPSDFFQKRLIGARMSATKFRLGTVNVPRGTGDGTTA